VNGLQLRCRELFVDIGEVLGFGRDHVPSYWVHAPMRVVVPVRFLLFVPIELEIAVGELLEHRLRPKP
jgi:hypothetical protein